eukprot:364861-Chlamydomonas_euryale.AAC.12
MEWLVCMQLRARMHMLTAAKMRMLAQSAQPTHARSPHTPQQAPSQHPPPTHPPTHARTHAHTYAHAHAHVHVHAHAHVRAHSTPPQMPPQPLCRLSRGTKKREAGVAHLTHPARQQKGTAQGVSCLAGRVRHACGRCVWRPRKRQAVLHHARIYKQCTIALHVCVVYGGGT